MYVLNTHVLHINVHNVSFFYSFGFNICNIIFICIYVYSNTMATQAPTLQWV
jgi:hypothetical protein